MRRRWILITIFCAIVVQLAPTAVAPPMDEELHDDDTESVDIALDARRDTVGVVNGLRNAQPVVVVWQPSSTWYYRFPGA